MSIFSRLFNRKEQVLNSNAVDSKTALNDTEEENLEDEEDIVPENAPVDSVEEEQEEEGTYEVVELEIHPAKIICPDCGGITLEGLEFCDKCGGELL